MAYITAENVKAIREALKAAFPTVKFSVRKEHHSSVNVNIMEADFAFAYEADGVTPVKDCSINQYHTHHYKNEEILKQMIDIIKYGSDRKFYDNSDAMTDYFDTAFYISINQGSWDKPFVLKARKARKVAAPVVITPAGDKELAREVAAWTEAENHIDRWMKNSRKFAA